MEIVTTQGNSSYFEETSEVRTKDLDTICVLKQWNLDKFSDFCKITKSLGWYEMKEYKKPVISPEESMMLVEFYDKHEKLITTMMEIIRRASNPNIGNSVEALMKRTASHRDRTTYSVTLHANNKTLRNLSRGRLVLSVLLDYASQENCTSKDLADSFKLPKNALKRCQTESDKGMSGFFTNESQWLKLEDGDYMVAIGWNINNLNKFIDASSTLLYDISTPVRDK